MNTFNSATHHRRSIRLKGYDYSQNGLYFITICTQDHKCLFGTITDSTMHLNHAGKMIENYWNTLPERFPTIELHTYTIMPNHFHAIIGICETGLTSDPKISDILCAFKSLTTLEYSRAVIECHYPPFNKRLWQRNYYEHIIRNDISHRKIIEYIINNPANWEKDEYNDQK